ncbi:MAG: hypothetical protein MJ177_06415 [Clostridia bacterium]|nr:hypothetical protein [Clostridia bacterium]
MKKITSIIMAIIMICLPLTASAAEQAAQAAAAATVSEEELPAEEGGLLSGLTSLFAPLEEIFIKLKEIVIKLLDLLGLSSGAAKPEFNVRTWESEEGIPAVYQPLLNEFNKVTALARGNSGTCVISKTVKSSYRLKNSSGGNTVNGGTGNILKSLFPELTRELVSTADEGVSINDYIAPLNGSLNASQVKYASRTMNADGTSKIELTLYGESYSDTSTLTSPVIKDGIYSKNDFNTAAFAVSGFGAHIENVTITILFDTYTNQLIREDVLIPAYYDFEGTLTVIKDQQSEGWVYYDTSTMVNFEYFWK